MASTLVCKSSISRLANPHAQRFAAHQFSHLAAARPSLAKHSPSGFILPRYSHEGAQYASSSSSGQGPVASSSSVKLDANENLLRDRPPAVIPENPTSASASQGTKTAKDNSLEGKRLSADAASPQVAARPPKPPTLEKPKPRLVGRKAALSLTPGAVARIRALLSGPHPQLIRIGVRNKGCAGMSYHLEYVEKPGTFDEVVEQDGVRVLIDSKALFSIIGSEMDWVEDRLSSKFAFKNPNVKDACGCGESFNI